jgi:hypothetical protein
MDAVVELVVSALVALAAAALAQFGLSFEPADHDARAVRRSPVAMAAAAPPAKHMMVAPVSEECPEKARLMDAAARAPVEAETEAAIDVEAVEAAVEVALAQAEKDVEAALEAAERSRAWADAQRVADEQKAAQAAA